MWHGDARTRLVELDADVEGTVDELGVKLAHPLDHARKVPARDHPVPHMDGWRRNRRAQRLQGRFSSAQGNVRKIQDISQGKLDRHR